MYCTVVLTALYSIPAFTEYVDKVYTNIVSFWTSYISFRCVPMFNLFLSVTAHSSYQNRKIVPDYYEAEGFSQNGKPCIIYILTATNPPQFSLFCRHTCRMPVALRRKMWFSQNITFLRKLRRYPWQSLNSSFFYVHIQAERYDNRLQRSISCSAIHDCLHDADEQFFNLHKENDASQCFLRLCKFVDGEARKQIGKSSLFHLFVLPIMLSTPFTAQAKLIPEFWML